MVSSNNKLEIFENFIKDPALKKQTGISSDSIDGTWDEAVPVSTNLNTRFDSASNRIVTVNAEDTARYCEYRMQNALPFGIVWQYYRLMRWIAINIGSKKKYMRTSGVSAQDFFNSLKLSPNILEKDKSMIDQYETVMRNASANGQTALVEKVLAMKDVVMGEIKLISLGLKKYLTEEQIVKFYSMVNDDKRHLKLTWIKNFARVIPSDVTELKKKMDQALVFDNYVILHYDPKSTGVCDTEEEIKKKKDPILFGVIAGSNKLYFIADWIDEVCDLTLDKLVDTLGEKALTINNKTVTKYINTITV